MYQPDNQLNKIQQKAASLYKIIQDLKLQPEFYDEVCMRWEDICRNVPGQVAQGLIKVAVVGAVKSGKSTFINSLFHADFLKRGAGVVTSVITRIQQGNSLKSELVIKSWDMVNEEILDAMLSLDHDCYDKNVHFDVRRKQDRKCLQELYKKFSAKTSFVSDTVKSEMIMIRNILKNYDFCSDFIKPDEYVFELKDGDFLQHKEFTGDPSRAFFIKDAIIEVNFGDIDSGVEIADCQGIDSADTAQLNRVLEYIETSNLIIYLISSRIGLREADMRLLSIIFKMGIGDNVIFIVNCDLNEHETLNDLLKIVDTIKQDLGCFDQNLNIYSFSSLFNLYKRNLQNLSEKEKQQKKIWESGKDIIEYTSDMSEKFLSCFKNRITNDRQNIIFANPLKRMTNIQNGLQNKIKIYSDTFLNDSNNNGKSVQELKNIQKGIERFKLLFANLQNSIEQDLKKNIDAGLDNYLYRDKNSVRFRIKAFIDNYVFDFRKFEEQISTIGFPKAMFLISRDFKNSFDHFLLEYINPELGSYIKSQQISIDSKASRIYETYNDDIFNLYKNFGIMSKEVNSINNLLSIKNKLGIKEIPLIFTARYNARIKLGSLAGLGLYSFFLIIMKKIGKESISVNKILLSKAILNFKKEVLKSITLQINEYKTKIQTEYFFKIIHALSEEISDALLDQLKFYSVDIEKIEGELKKESSEKAEKKKFFNKISRELKTLS